MNNNEYEYQLISITYDTVFFQYLYRYEICNDGSKNRTGRDIIEIRSITL